MDSEVTLYNKPGSNPCTHKSHGDSWAKVSIAQQPWFGELGLHLQVCLGEAGTERLEVGHCLSKYPETSIQSLAPCRIQVVPSFPFSFFFFASQLLLFGYCSPQLQAPWPLPASPSPEPHTVYSFVFLLMLSLACDSLPYSLP